MSIRCFTVERSTSVRRSLRRYASRWNYDSTPAKNLLPCPARGGEYSCHDESVLIDTIEVPIPVGLETDERITQGDFWPHDDERWPRVCRCGYEFKDVDFWQLATDRLWLRPDTGELLSLGELPPGAMYHADWMLIEGTDHYRGPDGHSLVVILPDNTPWNIDGRANNCDSPCAECGVPYLSHKYELCQSYRDARPHKCWVRHGQAPNITVDKNGVTCGAGAGSIATRNYHGFLRNGEFTN
jgi:hypothetical protein